MRNFSPEIAKSVVTYWDSSLGQQPGTAAGTAAEKKNGDFLEKSTNKHPVFFADSLSNTIGNTLEPLSLHLGGGRVESRPVRHPSAKGSNRAQGYRRSGCVTGRTRRSGVDFLWVLGPDSIRGISERLLWASEQSCESVPCVPVQ